MGTGSGGTTTLRGGSTFSDNIANLKSKFPITAKGYFGKPGQGRTRTRNIESANPARTAATFAMLASRNPVSVISIGGKPSGIVLPPLFITNCLH